VAPSGSRKGPGRQASKGRSIAGRKLWAAFRAPKLSAGESSTSKASGRSGGAGDGGQPCSNFGWRGNKRAAFLHSGWGRARLPRWGGGPHEDKIKARSTARALREGSRRYAERRTICRGTCSVGRARQAAAVDRISARVGATEPGSIRRRCTALAGRVDNPPPSCGRAPNRETAGFLSASMYDADRGRANRSDPALSSSPLRRTPGG